MLPYSQNCACGTRSGLRLLLLLLTTTTNDNNNNKHYFVSLKKNLKTLKAAGARLIRK